MEAELRPTMASEIVPPVRREFVLVELRDLKTVSGERVRVRCDRPDPTVVLEHFALPGAYPKAKAPPTSGERVRNVLRMIESAPALVHRWTAFAGEDGAEVRPAFHCDDAHAVAGSQPWAELSIGDKLTVVNAFMDLTGFGGAAEEDEFPAGE